MQAVKLVLGLGGFLLAAQAAQLSLPSVQASPGQTIRTGLYFASQGARIAAVQVDLEFDAGMSIAASLGPAGSASGKSLAVGDLSAATKRFLIYGFNQTMIADGMLVELAISVRAGASAGTYSLRLSGAVGSDEAGTSVAVSALDGSLTVGAAAGIPACGANRVLNAATYGAGAVAPGEIVTIFGANLGPAEGVAGRVVNGRLETTAAGTQVLFDGVAAPLLYVRADQINAIVPYAVFNRVSAQVQVDYGGIRSSPVLLPVVDASPGIFTLNNQGAGPGAIRNQDLSVNGASNAAARGSVVMIYATGEGQTSPAGADGRIADLPPYPQPLLPVRVNIGGQNAEILYAGTAPGFVAGAMQINFRVPSAAPTGDAIPVTVMVGARTSQPGVTLAIR